MASPLLRPHMFEHLYKLISLVMLWLFDDHSKELVEDFADLGAGF